MDVRLVRRQTVLLRSAFTGRQASYSLKDRGGISRPLAKEPTLFFAIVAEAFVLTTPRSAMDMAPGVITRDQQVIGLTDVHQLPIPRGFRSAEKIRQFPNQSGKRFRAFQRHSITQQFVIASHQMLAETPRTPGFQVPSALSPLGAITGGTGPTNLV